MFYLTMHSTHFYIRLHSVGHMVKDNSDRKREKEGRKEMFYLTTHSTHFYIWKEGNVLFNDSLNTFLYMEGR